MAKKKDFNKFEEFSFWFLDKTFGKLFSKWEDEDAEKRFNKSRGIKVFNITWIIIALILIAIYFVSKSNIDFKEMACLYKAEDAYHKEEKEACENLGMGFGCDLYYMNTQAFYEINNRHDLNVSLCKN